MRNFGDCANKKSTILGQIPLNLVPLGTSYLFPADIYIPNSRIIEYGRRILSKKLLTTTYPVCLTCSFTDDKSTLLRQNFQLTIPTSGFFQGLFGPSISYSV
jgi:hypothetical protein